MAHQLGVDVQRHLYAPGPAHGVEQPGVRSAFLVLDAEARRDHAFTFGRAAIGFRFGIFQKFEVDVQDALGAPTEHRQRTVRRHRFDRFALVEVVGEFGPFDLLALDHLSLQLAMRPKVITQLADQLSILGKALHQNLAGAIERNINIRHSLIRVDKLVGLNLWIERRIFKQRIGQRFQSRLDGDLRLGAALLFVGQIKVFKTRLAVGEQQRLFQHVGHLALLFDGGDDADPTLFQLTQVTEALFEIAHLCVVQSAGHFFTITRDKRHRGPFVEQSNSGDNLRFTRVEFLCNALFDAGQSKHAASSFFDD